MIDVEGIVISDSPYKETSKLIKIITREYGIISLLAKGCRTLKSDLRCVTTKLTYGQFHIIYKESGLSTLISVDIKNNLKNIKKDISKISYVSFILDLTEQVMKQNENEEIFDLLMNAVLKIDENYDAAIITSILELKYLDYLGVMPIIDGCSVCGSTKSIATLSSIRGGYICNNCLSNDKIVDEKTIKLIRMFYYVDIYKITNIEISDKIKKEINDFIDDYYDRYTGLYLKSKIFLKNLNKLS
ncbi:MAG: DNA repair protein RecO [Bacilli bacterium]|nr:DNA repair protein RecO [Bacilli bacterium]